MVKTDILIIGAGIIGLSVAREIHARHPDATIIIIEKEESLGCHASGRNSGVLHAGFYYTPDSLKSKFTVDGNRLLTEYCVRHNLSILTCGKVVVARDEKERAGLYELKKRGEKNGVLLQMVEEEELAEIEPNARTFKNALYSPTTSVVNPKEVLLHIARSFKEKVTIVYNEKFLRKITPFLAKTTNHTIRYRHIINSAGLYADKIAHQFGIGLNYTVIPFKGLYLEYHDSALIQKHIYPVPDLRNPFLGVHFTKTVNGNVKIGPTAIPAFWRENYRGFSNFSPKELYEILFYEMKLFLSNSFNFRNTAFEESKKYFKNYFIQQASHLVKDIDVNNFGAYINPGIRAQVVNKETMRLEMDFIVKQDDNSTHILNAVSPAFTSALSFSKFIVDKVEEKL
ncbi:MAG: L-2-hydroxyglutarate oxidase [Candidatus Brocadiaceae bacterium]|nr:L-2-hydroxyglutarate oxidase [Candidatus Brocadiaceae bacterium]